MCRSSKGYKTFMLRLQLFVTSQKFEKQRSVCFPKQWPRYLDFCALRFIALNIASTDWDFQISSDTGRPAGSLVAPGHKQLAPCRRRVDTEHADTQVFNVAAFPYGMRQRRELTAPAAPAPQQKVVEGNNAWPTGDHNQKTSCPNAMDRPRIGINKNFDHRGHGEKSKCRKAAC